MSTDLPDAPAPSHHDGTVVDGSAALDPQEMLPLPRQGEGYADVIELDAHHNPHWASENEQDAREAYERLRRDLEERTGRGGRPWHMLTPVERDRWISVLRMIDPLHR